MFTFVGTQLLTRLVLEFPFDEPYAELQMALLVNPELGPVVAGTGGVRELRQAAPRRGKRGDHGRVIVVPNVAAIREKVGLSQSRFATLLGVSVRTLQDWEQGRRAPTGAARTLLLVADRNPRVLLEVA